MRNEQSYEYNLPRFDYPSLYEWVGEPIKSDANRIYYGQLLTKENNSIISKNDTIELLSGKEWLPFVAQALAFWEEKATGLWKLETRWYYRPENLPLNILEKFPFGQPLPNEIFLSDERDENDVQSIIGKASVIYAESAFPIIPQQKTYLLRCFFNPAMSMFKPCQPLATERAPSSFRAYSSVHQSHLQQRTIDQRNYLSTANNAHSLPNIYHAPSDNRQNYDYSHHLEGEVADSSRKIRHLPTSSGYYDLPGINDASMLVKYNPRNEYLKEHYNRSYMSPLRSYEDQDRERAHPMQHHTNQMDGSSHSKFDEAYHQNFQHRQALKIGSKRGRRPVAHPVPPKKSSRKADRRLPHHGVTDNYKKNGNILLANALPGEKSTLKCICENGSELVWSKYSYPGLQTSMDADKRRTTFLHSMRKWYATWGVRPDVVLYPWRAQPDDKSPTAEYWQDYKKVRIDWRERAGIRKDHFVLQLQHYMRIDGFYKDTYAHSVENIVKRVKVFHKKKRKRALRDVPSLPGPSLKEDSESSGQFTRYSEGMPTIDRSRKSLNGALVKQSKHGVFDSAIGGGDNVSEFGADSGDDTKVNEKKPVGTRTKSTSTLASGYEDDFRLRGKHWWEEESIHEAGTSVLLYPTSDTHQWSTHNGIEHRLMEIEFEDGNDLQPPKESLKEYAYKWRPDCIFRYVMGIDSTSSPLSRLQGIYQRQESLKHEKYWYRLVPGKNNSIRNCFDNSSPMSQGKLIEASGSQIIYRNSSSTFSERDMEIDRDNGQFGLKKINGRGYKNVDNRHCHGFLNAEISWDDDIKMYVLHLEGSTCPDIEINFDMDPHKCILQEVARWSDVDENGKGGGVGPRGHLLVMGCMTLFPPRQMLNVYGEESVKSVCSMIWQGCFRANPERVAFSLFCRLVTARESPDALEVSDEILQQFEARKYDIFRSWLVLKLEEGEFVVRSHYILFMEWFLCTAQDQPLITKILRMWDLIGACDLPFAGYPISSSDVALKHHHSILNRENIAGRYCFRFSKNIAHLTVDFTCFLGPPDSYSESTASAAVVSRRLEVVCLTEGKSLFRLDPNVPVEKLIENQPWRMNPVDFTDPVSFVRAWGNQLKIKYETRNHIDPFILRWTPH